MFLNLLFPTTPVSSKLAITCCILLDTFMMCRSTEWTAHEWFSERCNPEPEKRIQYHPRPPWDWEIYHNLPHCQWHRCKCAGSCDLHKEPGSGRRCWEGTLHKYKAKKHLKMLLDWICTGSASLNLFHQLTSRSPLQKLIWTKDAHMKQINVLLLGNLGSLFV